jgi:hypothetical protein
MSKRWARWVMDTDPSIPSDPDRAKRPLPVVARDAVIPGYALGCAALAVLAAWPTAALGCAACGCSLSTEAAIGYSDRPGWTASVQFDFINQNQLRSGTKSVSNEQVAAINDAGGEQEVEKQTINRYITFGLTYLPTPNWIFNLQIPVVDRNHDTYGAAPNPLTPDLISGASFTRIGDARVVGSYQGLLPTHNLGLQLGLVLPTGTYGGPNADGTGVVGRNPVTFNSGPNGQSPSPDNLLDTSLQAGTGATQIVVGAYYIQAISQDFDAFINGQFQAALVHQLNEPGEDYRPGNQVNVSTGLRYVANPKLVPQLQLNILTKRTDQGTLADTISTGGTVIYLSPGASALVADRVNVYGFVQVPVYSHLTGYQLLPHWTASVGAAYSF